MPKKVYLVTITDQSDFDKVLERKVWGDRPNAEHYGEVWTQVNRKLIHDNGLWAQSIVYDVEELELY